MKSMFCRTLKVLTFLALSGLPGMGAQQKDGFDLIRDRLMLDLQKEQNPDAHLKLIRSALTDVNTLLAKTTPGKEHAKGLLFLFQLHQLNQDMPKALDILNTFIEKYPQAEEIRQVQVTKADLLMGLDRVQEAITYIQGILPGLKQDPLLSQHARMTLFQAYTRSASLAEASKVIEQLMTEVKDGNERWAIMLQAANLAKLQEDRSRMKSLLADIAKNSRDRRLVELAEFFLADSERLGKTLEPFEIKDARGRSFSTTDQKGKIVAVLFWATTFEPSVQILQTLDQLHKKHGAQGLVALGICLDEQKDSFEKFLKANPMEWFQVQDASKDLATLLEIKTPSHIILVDRKGTIRYSLLNSAGIEIAVEKLLKEQ